ncbi:MAG: glycosyltransferase family 39 protein [Deltaproteobacteria bacterium]|nr:glycosyltransferase family 39 protein [Deltaproteobacteria bacterium]
MHETLTTIPTEDTEQRAPLPPLGRERVWRTEIPHLVILTFLCLTLFFFNLGSRPLWDIDEGMHAATSKDMVLTGDWITPKLNGENFYDKPILYNWLAAVSFLVFGFTAFAARLPAALLGLGSVMVTYLLGRRIGGPTLGLLSGVALATNIEFIILSRNVIHDISLAFFVTLALVSFYRAFASEKQRTALLLLFYVSCGFAVLAKGPLGLLLPALVIGLFLIIKRRLAFIREMKMGWGVLVFLAVAAPWYVLISLKNSDYGYYFFIEQNLMRFLSPEAHHSQPFYYYFPVLLGGFLPWSWALPLALVRSFRKGLRNMPEGTLFVTLWFAVVFVFFSTASSKLSTYILPLFPAASLLVGMLWQELLETPTPALHRGVLLSFLPLVGILLGAVFYFQIHPFGELQSGFGVDLDRLNALLLLLLGGAGAALFLLFTRSYRAFFGTSAGLMALAFLFIVVAILPSVNPYRSTRGLAQELDRLVPPGEKLVFFEKLKDSALFYTDRKALVLDTPQQLMDYLASPKRVFCIIEKESLDELEKLGQMPYVIDQEGDKLIISNRKPT